MSSVTLTIKVKNSVADTRIAISTSPDLAGATFSSVVVPDSEFFIARHFIDGLAEDTQYYWAPEVGGQLFTDNIGKFRTPKTGAFSFKFAAASCANTLSNDPIFDDIRTIAPLFFMHMGDMHYRDIAVNSEALFHAAYDEVFSQSRQHQLYHEVPTLYTWDDHDYGPNDSDATSPSREASVAAYRRRVPSPPLAESGATDGIYYSFVIGRCLFIVSDLRSLRSPKTDPDTVDKVMMGATQEAWFVDLLNDDAHADKLIIWVSSLPWIGNPNAESDFWRGYTHERTRIANAIRDAGVADRLLMVAGDAHMVAIDDGSNHDYADGGGSFPVFQAAPLDQSNSVKGGPYSEGIYANHRNQFGVVEITDEGGPTIGVKLVGYRAGLVPLVEYQFNAIVGGP
jgi:phosphodiesterase/alkaline phosphatase D-like protein